VVDRELQEKCAVFGVFNGSDAARQTFFGLFGLQHRGQESSGIAATDGKSIRLHKGKGLVSHVYSEDVIESFAGCHIAMGHNRYGTSGGEGHYQPVSFYDDLVLAHNGNLPNVKALVDFCTEHNLNTRDLNDTELMYQAVSYFLHKGDTLADSIKQAFPLFTGAFSVLAMTKDSLVAVRDGYGIRPLSLGVYDNDHYVVSSETCAIDTVQAKILREVRPGEMIVIDKNGLRSEQLVAGIQKLDIFEYVYFARPESVMMGQRVYSVRKRLGEALAKISNFEADIVVPVPDSAVPAAEGYAEQRIIPLRHAIIKNRYIHRTFIMPSEYLRDRSADMKYNVVSEAVSGLRVVLVDDSIVRLNTAPRIVKRLFDAGAKEVHLMISSSPILFPDFYGIDLPAQNDLGAAHMTIEEMREKIGATTLTFLPYDLMVGAVGVPKENLYTGCFNGKYPIDIGERRNEFSYDVKNLT
jgi:amidophosphoribosyltransferase